MSKHTTINKGRVIVVADTGHNLVVAIFPFYKRVEYVCARGQGRTAAELVVHCELLAGSHSD